MPINKQDLIEEIVVLEYTLKQFIKNAPQFDRDEELAKLIAISIVNLKNIANQ